MKKTILTTHIYDTLVFEPGVRLANELFAYKF